MEVLKLEKIGFVSLGCSKNLIDTEMMIGYYKENGYEVVADPSLADVIVINTCGFIESAKEEAINTILEMAEYKKQNCKRLVVTGCLVERYLDELKQELPEVDLWIPIKEYDTIFNRLDYLKRTITTGKNYAYLRIADGCSNYCTYCAIPYIRGPLKSRTIEDILAEAKMLESQGYQEIILIAQDTARYGVDIYSESKLVALLQELLKLNFKWIRFLYTYPEMISDELINLVASTDRICHYFDIPIQHIADPVLKRMGRKSNGETIRNVISQIRAKIPDAVIRTTLIVGFPGEREIDFDELYKFVEETKFDRLGVFKYSPEEGTPAVKLPEQIPEERKEERYDQIMSLQQEVSNENNQQLIGKTLTCVIDSVTEDGKMYIARSYREVPEEDGVIFIEKEKEHQIGEFIDCKIKDAFEYDLVGSDALVAP